MNFKTSINLAFKNLKRKPLRTFLMTLLISLLSITLFIGSIIVVSLQNGLNNYKERLGADVIAVPYEATTQSSVDDILLQGITGNYYMSIERYEKIKTIEGVSVASTQFFLTSAKASCCSSRVQIIGFDPETDFVIQPWIESSYSSTIQDGDLVVGSNISVPDNRLLKFYGNNYKVVAQLAKTGTGLDNAVYTTMTTIKKMASSSSAITNNLELSEVDIDNSVSAVFVKVQNGYTPEEVSYKINSLVKTVKAQSAMQMTSNIASGLNGISTVIGVLIGVVWFLAIIILIITFTMISNERKKEFAILRTLGSSRGMISGFMIFESSIISLISSVIGIFISIIILIPLSSGISDLIDLPFLLPSIGLMVLFAVITIIVSLIVCVLSAVNSTRNITKNETGLLLREDA